MPQTGRRAWQAGFVERLRQQLSHCQLVVAKIPSRHLFHLFGSNRTQPGDQLPPSVQRQAQNPMAAKFARLVEQGVELVHLIGDPLGLDTLQLGLGHTLLGDTLNLGAQALLDLIGSKEMAIKGMMGNITMARSSVWDDQVVRSKMNPGLIETRVFAAKNGTPVDRPYMSAVGEARDLIGELVIESINTKGTSPKLDQLAAEKVKRVNELLQDSGEFGK